MSYLQSLTVFLVAAEEGSLLKAAKKLGLSQPTVSFHIDNLEKNFGCPLFNRTTKGVSLTVYGKQLYETTSVINELVHQTQNKISALLKGSTGHILIGASTIPSDYILPPIIAGFSKLRPDVTFSVATGTSKTILASFQRNEIPIAIVGSAPPQELNAIALWEDEMVLAAHPHLSTEIEDSKTKQWLNTFPLILRRESSGSRSVVLAALAKQNIALSQLNIVLEVDSNQALKSAIMHKAGIGFISRWAVQTELLNGELTVLPFSFTQTGDNLSRAVTLPNIKRNFYALTGNSPQPACSQAFFEYLLNTGRLLPGGDVSKFISLTAAKTPAVAGGS